ncbi:hypothetical protein Afil01_42440 [Actinorhabdospora filicis]|uniref:Lipoprotein n=1 Tax=Actinorhabdospora filicis TaxID=1785913 RepID=A0A9W6SP08_9ACTN|nr:hypothetical protein [Actinorhabdospora filicis]GLZ79437.1 hypothetical protein Afil01_42440 [Actinorhabdospora filicis]
MKRLVLMLALALTACAGNEQVDIPIVAYADAVRMAQAQGLELAARADAPLVWADGEPYVGKCTGQDGERPDSIYSYASAFELYPADAVQYIVDLHDAWVAASWPITDFKKTREGREAQVIGTNPANQIVVRADAFETGRILLSISTPCFEEPSGTAPFGPRYGPSKGALVPSPS